MNLHKLTSEDAPCPSAFEKVLGDASAYDTRPLSIDKGDATLQFLTRIITETVSTSALYCFGIHKKSRTVVNAFYNYDFSIEAHFHYYFFLVVTDFKADVPSNVADLIYERTGGRCTATILMHSKKSLCQKTGDQQNFLYQMMQRSLLLFQEKENPPYLPYKAVPCRNLFSAEKYLQQRKRTAELLMEVAVLDSGSATKIDVYLLHLIVEQTCLGLIRLFLGYTPNQFSLRFLLELCAYFTPLTDAFFPRELEKDKELFRMLSRSTASLRYGAVDAITSFDYELLRFRCCAFVEAADKIAIKELDRLELLNKKK